MSKKKTILSSIYNKDEIYFLHNHITGGIVRIGNKNDLLKEIARMIKYPSLREISLFDTKSWTKTAFDRIMLDSNYCNNKRNAFIKQNLSGNDVDVQYITSWEWVFDEDLGKSDESYRSYATTRHESPKPYTFYTSNGAIFDIRNILNEVRNLLTSGDKEIFEIKNSFHHLGPRPRSHTTWATKYPHFPRENRSRIDCKEQGVKYRQKLYEGYYYNTSRRSSGWKDKKYKKQWMHNLDYKKDKCNSAKEYWKHYIVDEDNK